MNWRRSRVSNGPTEAINNLVKRVKRAAFGFRRFAHYRIRALLYAGKPNWALLATITPRQYPKQDPLTVPLIAAGALFADRPVTVGVT